MSGIGTTGFILIILVALILFGPSKLPELGRAFGRTLREFKNGAKELMGDNEEQDRQERKEVTPPPSATNSYIEVKNESTQADDNKPSDKRLPE